MCSMLPRTLFRPPLLARQFSLSTTRWNSLHGTKPTDALKPAPPSLVDSVKDTEQPSTPLTTGDPTESSLRDAQAPPGPVQLEVDSRALHSPHQPSSPSTFTPASSPSSSDSNSTSPNSTSESPPTAKQIAYAQEIERLKAQAKEWAEKAVINLRHRADDFTVKSKEAFSHLGQHLNKVTGYEEIEALKKSVVAQEERINLARRSAREAKTAYEAAVIQRSNSQREVNDLLQRKSMWTDADVGRFTSLVRQDHLYEQEEGRAKAAVDETEDAVDKEFSQLLRTILARYHEEQVWSDKIRSASTYGSLVALGLNMLVFLTAIVFVEPWKRRRLAQTFEAKVEELSKGNEKVLQEAMVLIQERMDKQDGELSSLRGDVIERLDGAASVARRESATVPVVPAVVVAPPPQSPTPVPPIAAVIPIDQRYFELGLIGGGAFIAGILSTVLFSR